ncbi:hypothetical protein NC652_016954 [Populus alba x Populus x berolinensis]|nr:hypothetical protein NC652_016954 [Populus alba x Populus x berolinensis]
MAARFLSESLVVLELSVAMGSNFLSKFAGGFENVVDKRKALQEMFRVLRPGEDVFYQ